MQAQDRDNEVKLLKTLDDVSEKQWSMLMTCEFSNVEDESCRLAKFEKREVTEISELQWDIMLEDFDCLKNGIGEQEDSESESYLISMSDEEDGENSESNSVYPGYIYLENIEFLQSCLQMSLAERRNEWEFDGFELNDLECISEPQWSILIGKEEWGVIIEKEWTVFMENNEFMLKEFGERNAFCNEYLLNEVWLNLCIII